MEIEELKNIINTELPDITNITIKNNLMTLNEIYNTSITIYIKLEDNFHCNFLSKLGEITKDEKEIKTLTNLLTGNLFGIGTKRSILFTNKINELFVKKTFKWERKYKIIKELRDFMKTIDNYKL